MKKLLGLAVVVGVMACHKSPPKTSADASNPGASSATNAIKEFFDAVRAGDLQAMSLAWGTKEGPTRDHIPPSELEKREVILQCYFNHDSYRIVGPAPDPSGGHAYRVELVRSGKKRTTTVSTIEGPSHRWYVQSLDIAAVRDFCGSEPANP